jgi:hypothetical protein
MLKTLRRMTLLAALVLGLRSQADQVVMQNGDTLNGTVLSVSANVLVLQNENLGTVTLARDKVSSVVFGAGVVKAVRPLIPVATASASNAAPASTPSLRGIGEQTNLVQQVQSQVLGSAGPDAIGKFNELLNGLSTGKFDMNQLRAQAKAAADELRSYKKDLGPGDSAEVDSYLAILDNFLLETAPTYATANTASPPTNAPVTVASVTTNVPPAAAKPLP